MVGFEQATTINTLKIGKKYLIINQSLVEIEQMRWNGSYEGSGDAALVDNLNKALQISMDVYYFLFFRIVRTCCSLLKQSYFSLLTSGTWCVASGTWCVCTTNVENEL